MTWIDHGYTPIQNYCRGAAERPDYDFLGTLRRNGLLAIWSYHDTLSEASQSLNMLAAPRSSSGHLLRRSLHHARAGHWLVALHYLRTVMRRNIFSRKARFLADVASHLRVFVVNTAYSGALDQGVSRLSRSLSRAVLQAFRCCARVNRRSSSPCPDDPCLCLAADRLPLPFTLSELRRAAPVCYPERRVPLTQAGEDDLMLFATMEVVHAADAYLPEALARLVREHGLHIGHCYLLNTLPYLHGLFQKEKGGLMLASQWLQFTAELSRLVAASRLWNPPLGELVRWFRSLQAVKVRPLGSKAVELENQSPSLIRDCTLMLDRSIPPGNVLWAGSAPVGSKITRDWCLVWGDLPARQRVVVRWASGEDADSTSGSLDLAKRVTSS